MKFNKQVQLLGSQVVNFLKVQSSKIKKQNTRGICHYLRKRCSQSKCCSVSVWNIQKLKNDSVCKAQAETLVVRVPLVSKVSTAAWEFPRKHRL